MDPILWFDISRGTLIVASLIAALGGFGVLHFGKINSTNQNIEIANSNARAAEANKIAADANERAESAKLESKEATKKTVELKLDVISANKALEKEKHKTETIRLEAEKAKIEREKLQQKTILLTNKQRIITSFKIKLKVLLPTTSKEIGAKYASQGMMSSSITPASFKLINSDDNIIFNKDPDSYWQQINPNLIEMGTSYSPDGQTQIIGNDIEVLRKIESLNIACNSLPDLQSEKSALKSEEMGQIIITLEINGNVYQNKEISGPSKEITNRSMALTLSIDKFIEKCVNEYLKDIGL